MDESTVATIARLESEEASLILDSFEHDDAWRLGTLIRERCVDAGHAVAIDIRRPSGAVLFHASLPGATADQEDWIARKSAIVFRFETSSLLLETKFTAYDIGPTGWLDPTRFVASGGSVPIRVTGAGIVAAVTISGLASEEDHALGVEGLRALRDDDGRH